MMAHLTQPEVNLDNANEGMQNGDYYATILIPSNFTQCLNSASTKDKQIATITYSPNQATNYLATQIIGSAIKTIETNLQAKVNSKVAENLAQKLEEVPSSLQMTYQMEQGKYQKDQKV